MATEQSYTFPWEQSSVVIAEPETNRKSDLEVTVWVHGHDSEEHLNCEDHCEDLGGSEVRGQG